MLINSHNHQKSPAFGKFIKIKGNYEQLNNFRENLRDISSDYVDIAQKRHGKKSELYILSVKHFDKFIDLMKNVHLRKLRRNLEKYLAQKPGKMNIEKAEKLLLENNFKL